MIQVIFSFNNAVEYSKMIRCLIAGTRTELQNEKKCVRDPDMGWKMSSAAVGLISTLSSITGMESPLYEKEKSFHSLGMWAWPGVLIEFLDSAERIASGIDPR